MKKFVTWWELSKRLDKIRQHDPARWWRIRKKLNELIKADNIKAIGQGKNTLLSVNDIRSQSW